MSIVNKRISEQSALQSSETFTSVLDIILKEKYDEGLYLWELTTLWLDIKEDFNVELPTEIVDKLGCLQVLMVNDAFFKRVDAFYNICNTLNEGAPAFSIFDPVEPEEIAWAFVEIVLMRDMLSLSPSIKDFIEFSFKDFAIPSYISYMLEKDEFDEGELKQLIADSIATPTTEVDIHVIEQLKDLVYQLGQLGTDVSKVVPEAWVLGLGNSLIANQPPTNLLAGL